MYEQARATRSGGATNKLSPVHRGRSTKFPMCHRDDAEMERHLLWEQDEAGSNPVVSTER